MLRPRSSKVCSAAAGRTDLLTTDVTPGTLHQNPFDTQLEILLGHRAITTCTQQLDGDHTAVGIDIDKLDIATVGLHCGPDDGHDFLDLSSHVIGLRHW